MYSADWVKSLDELEKKVNTAETNVRRVRRRRMEVALRHDIIGNHNVIVTGATEVIVTMQIQHYHMENWTYQRRGSRASIRMMRMQRQVAIAS